MIPKCIIIGAGDVVANRLLPALLNVGFAAEYLILHNGKSEIRTREIEDARITVRELSTREISVCLTKHAPSVVFIATPPDPRPALCEVALNQGHLVIAEKPLATTYEGIARLRGLGQLSQRLFALSYYTLEKALTWTCVNLPDQEHSSCLQLPNGQTMATVRDIYRQVGPLHQLQINICEGPVHEPLSGQKLWYQDYQNGVWLDMGVHIFMLAIISGVKAEKLEEADLRIVRPDQFEIEHIDKGLHFSARFGKHYLASEVDRNLFARFSNGTAHCKFDTMTSYLNDSKGKKIELSNRFPSLKYQSLVKQVGVFVERGGWNSTFDRHDLFDIQLSALSSLIFLWNNVSRS